MPSSRAKWAKYNDARDGVDYVEEHDDGWTHLHDSEGLYAPMPTHYEKKAIKIFHENITKLTVDQLRLMMKAVVSCGWLTDNQKKVRLLLLVERVTE